MSIESALYDRLSGYTDLTDLVGARIYPLANRGETYPAVSYFKVSASPVSSMGSDTGTWQYRMQVDVWAEAYSSMMDVKVEVLNALQRWTDTTTGVDDTFLDNEQQMLEGDAELYHTALDFMIWYHE